MAKDGSPAFEEWQVVAFLWDRAAQYQAGSGIVAALEEAAERVAEGWFADDVKSGNLDDMRERCRSFIERRRRAMVR